MLTRSFNKIDKDLATAETTISLVTTNVPNGTMNIDAVLTTFGNAVFTAVNDDVKVSGSTKYNDGVNLRFGSSGDVEHFWNGVNYYTDINGGGDWYIRDGNSSNTTRFTFDIDNGVLTTTRFQSTVATGTAPFTVASTTKVTNLNADLLDGLDQSQFLRSDANDTMSGRLTIDTPSDYWSTSLTSLTNAPLYNPEVRIGASATYIPFSHQVALMQGGYRTHVSTGLYKTPDSSWTTSGYYIALNDSGDNNPNEAFHFKPNGAISNTDNKLLLQNNLQVHNTYTATSKDIILSNSAGISNKLEIRSAGNATAYIDNNNGALRFADSNTDILNLNLTTNQANFAGLVRAPRFQSTQATGTAPFTVASTTKVTNLNADLLDGLTSTQFLRLNPDGDGVSVAYNDANPTLNGTSVAGVWNFGGDGTIDNGALEMDSINTIGTMNSGGGYYVGALNTTAGGSTTKVIDSAGNFTAKAITASGNVSAVNMTASGDMSAVGITASGNISASGNLYATGQSSGDFFYSHTPGAGSWDHNSHGGLLISATSATSAYNVLRVNNDNGFKLQTLGGTGGTQRWYTSNASYITFSGTTITASLSGKATTAGNADTATKLATARTIDITGDITASAVSFDGSANIAISASVNNNSHTHDDSTITGTQAATASTIAERDVSADINARLFRSNYAEQTTAPATTADICFRNSTTDNYMRFMSSGAFKSYCDSVGVSVDGHTHSYLPLTGKAADSNLLDGVDSTSFVRSDANDNKTGYLEFQDGSTNYLGFGNESDFRVYHDGTNAFLRNYRHAGGDIYFQGEDTEGTNHALFYMINNTARPYVRLYENGAERMRTVSTGIKVYGTMDGVATSAQFADVAENYLSDAVYVPGTVLGVGGVNEVTIWEPGMPLAGVVSTDPALIMNNADEIKENELYLQVALKGKIPCFVDGEAKKGQYLIACKGGKAIVSKEYIPEFHIGVCLEDSKNGMVIVKV